MAARRFLLADTPPPKITEFTAYSLMALISFLVRTSTTASSKSRAKACLSVSVKVLSLAKREHIATILPMLEKAIIESKLEAVFTPTLTDEEKAEIHKILSRESGLADQLIGFYESHGRPPIDLIAVTSGPGLEPALWVGINFAKALSYLWRTKVVPVDHMEGHILASVFEDQKIAKLAFPSLALLVSGGHTELILMEDWGQYKKIGQTRDDAVGEAFDKVARLLSLPYPGGPEISRLADIARYNKN